MFRDININFNLQYISFFSFFFFKFSPCCYWPDWLETSSVRKAKTKRAIHFGLSSADLKSHQHKCALSCKVSSALKCIKSIIENNIYWNHSTFFFLKWNISIYADLSVTKVQKLPFTMWKIEVLQKGVSPFVKNVPKMTVGKRKNI